ncbi:hypothetical protein KUTeg_022292 [Tegillarca granosa]|uniref:Uncharacterized protein n=1 Tax=Tegillarca granosa TaxID=220873 RepID=A0ABQ9E5S8_TEGGR|nr:hypothetical protein KUTeg_022292 [Tegillarca granosa]
MYEAVFTYCFALHVFQAGVRRNNANVIHAVCSVILWIKHAFLPGDIHRDSLVRIQCPPQISAFIEEHESHSLSENDCKGEGGAFVLECKNKMTKILISPGIPEQKHWKNVCRNLDRLSKIRQNFNTILEIKDDDPDYSYCPNINREIFHLRKLIRLGGFLMSKF